MEAFAGVAGVATVASAPEPAGEGVAGTAVAVFEDCAGAAGGTGLEAVAGAGVEGTFEEDAAAGAALGYGEQLGEAKLSQSSYAYLRDHTNDKTLLLDLVGLNGIGILEDLA